MLVITPPAFEDDNDRVTPDEPPLELEPVRVASLLRELQSSATLEHSSSIVLDLDESLHVAAHQGLLRSALFDLMDHALQVSGSGARIILRCRTEETGVAIEVESEFGAAALDFAHIGRAGPVELAVAAMDGFFSFENLPDEGYVVGLHFPLLSKRPSSAPPPSSSRR
jgi:hypothetical protein